MIEETPLLDLKNAAKIFSETEPFIKTLLQIEYYQVRGDLLTGPDDPITLLKCCP